MSSLFSALIETDALAEHLAAGTVRLLDASWHQPIFNRNAHAEFLQKHIPGAAFFDIDAVADTTSSLPHMLPTPAQFEKAVGALGIGSDDFVVVYDTHGIMTAPRAWWTFRAFGHDRVSVLNGGLPKWEREGRPLESGETQREQAFFKANFRPELVQSRAQMQVNLSQSTFQTLDLRPTPRFLGKEPEPRPGLRLGHMPGSRNVGWGELVDSDTKTFLPLDAVRRRFDQAGLNIEKPVVCSCGSGVTACMGALGLYLLGHDQVPVYDGSWAEWGADETLPVEV